DAIKQLCEDSQLDVHFLVGGTQTNLTVISAALRTHQCAISAHTGHICVHETGAIEATGHKAMAVESADGKLTAAQVQAVYDAHWKDETHEHIAQPKMVYISNPTEIGTIYSKQELEALRKVCDACHLYLFMDGARLGYGLCASDNDLDLPSIARLCDVFYIGGTKVGALFGEALVIRNEALKEDFRYIIKQKGGMLAKGRLLGIQFLELFKDGLYFEMAQHGVDMAMLLKKGLIEAGYSFFIESSTNQQFIIVENERLDQLKKKYCYSLQGTWDATHSVIRICTSWATKQEDIVALLNDMR
ncbi:MAG: beta-eliminating lyase-related protein, partial [Lachnospiraceae bacterium]